MPDTACLHIQARDTDPVRVVALPGASVRIGRASYCEVRLAEPELAEEECRLRRRGKSWQLVPTRRDGSVRLDGKSIEQPCPIAFDVPFRVGEHWLTLRPTGSAAPEWGLYRSPSPRDRPTAVRPESAAFPAPPEEPSTDATSRANDVGSDLLARWEGRRRGRVGALGAGVEQKRWEERWKAAGERLRARPTAVDPYRPASIPLRVTDEPGTGRSVAEPPPLSARRERPGVRVRSIARRDGPPAVAFASPPPPLSPPQPPMSRGPRVGRSDDPGPTSDDPPRPRRERPDDRPKGARETPRPPAVPPVETEREVPADDGGNSVAAGSVVVPDSPAGASSADPPFNLPPFFRRLMERGVSIPSLDVLESPFGTWIEPVVERGRDGEFETPSSLDPTLATSGAIRREIEPDHVPSPPPEGGRRESALDVDVRPDSARDAGWAYEALFDADALLPGPIERDSGREAFARGDDPIGPPRRPRKPSVRPRKGAPTFPGREPAPEGSPTGSPLPSSAREWPSAREIFAASRLRADRPVPARPIGSRRPSQPVPTEPREPAHWAMPLWLGWPAAMASAVAVGVAGIGTAWTWSRDAFSAGQVAGRVSAVAGAPLDPLPEALARPDGAWWKTTAAGLVHWAQYIDRADAGKPGAAEEVETLLETASQASPVESQVLYARARPSARPGREVGLFRGVGLSRDVLALAWSGHQLLAAGKNEAALRVYREALEMAGRAELSRLGPSAYDDDPQVRRYALPHEALIGSVIRDMVDQDRWTYAEWSKALPDFAVARIVAARLLRERGELAASNDALDAVAARASSDPAPPDGTSSALRLAAQAEALALKSRWDESEDYYRQAIELMPDDAIRRAWWMNLADIALRLNDEAKRRKALEAARGLDSGDEIARHAVEMLKYTGAPGEKAKP